MRTPVEDREGHLPTLVACFLHFDLSFMLWVLIGALGIFIAEDLRLSASQKGFLVAVPILSGAAMRVPLGMLADRFGGKRVGTSMLAALFVPLALGWLAGSTWPTLLLVGLLLGTAGASFAVALPLASAWYPANRQGLVMGIAAAGNSGTVITNLLAPRLAAIVGWHNVLGLAMVPLAVVLGVFVIAAREAPRRADRAAEHAATLRAADLWWFCLFYSVTFGGYVGLSSFLPLFLRDQHGVSPATAGTLTAIAAFVGSGIRPLGGWLADRVGGTRVLGGALLGLTLAYLGSATVPTLVPSMILMVSTMACCGLGNGAVFQLVPLRFRADLGLVTGIVGAIGGVGGFLLPIVLSVVRQSGRGFGSGFLVLAAAAGIVCAMLQVLTALRAGWRISWRSPALSLD